MIIYIPNNSEQSIGGGWTFLRNIKRALGDRIQWAHNWQEADLILIASASMTDANEIEEAAKAGKPIVFRVDNIPRKSRNRRGRIYDKMKRFGELSEHIIYQSEWAKMYAGWLVKNDEKSSVIYNGVDITVFHQSDEPVIEKNRYLFVHYNRDENKRFPEAFYHFHMAWRNDPDASLTIVGNFSPEMIDANFDFFGGEKIEYIPPISDMHVLADIYREHDVLLFPAFMDASPNTILEARASGLKVECVNETGGTKELLNPELDISLERMGNEYHAIFDLILNTKEITA